MGRGVDDIVPTPSDPETYAIIGAAIEVHRILGPGYLEAVYAEALSIELSLRGIPHQREAPLQIYYNGEPLGCTYRADFLCYGHVIVEVKAQSATGKVEAAQVANYLRATKQEIGLLLNFGTPVLEKRRVIYKADWARSRTPTTLPDSSESSEGPHTG